jgi:hypothetical protein
MLETSRVCRRWQRLSQRAFVSILMEAEQTTSACGRITAPNLQLRFWTVSSYNSPSRKSRRGGSFHTNGKQLIIQRAAPKTQQVATLVVVVVDMQAVAPEHELSPQTISKRPLRSCPYDYVISTQGGLLGCTPTGDAAFFPFVNFSDAYVSESVVEVDVHDDYESVYFAGEHLLFANKRCFPAEVLHLASGKRVQVCTRSSARGPARSSARGSPRSAFPTHPQPAVPWRRRRSPLRSAGFLAAMSLYKRRL